MAADPGEMSLEELKALRADRVRQRASGVQATRYPDGASVTYRDGSSDDRDLADLDRRIAQLEGRSLRPQPSFRRVELRRC
jgi:hypothetical protein